MYYGINILIGMLISLLIFLNGALAKYVGNFSSLLIVHSLGLLSIWFFKFFTKIPNKKLPRQIYLYFGGILSIMVIFLENLTMKEIGVSVTIIFLIVGQLVSSLIIDHFGLLGRKSHKINREKMFGFILILVGIIFINLS